jgi:hypothetical protein
MKSVNNLPGIVYIDPFTTLAQRTQKFEVRASEFPENTIAQKNIKQSSA